MTEEIGGSGNWWQRRPLWQKIGLVILGLFVGSAALAGIFDSGEADETATAPSSTTTMVDETTTTEAETTTTEATTTTSSTTTAPTTTTTSTTTTTLPPFVFEADGQGDDIVEFVGPESAMISTFTHAGNSNFIVAAYDSNAERIDGLVNEIGPYDGTVPLQFRERDGAVAFFEIKADGAWAIVVEDLAAAPIHTCGDPAGSGDAVVLVPEFAEQGGPATLTHNGDSNFIVRAWGTSSDGLVNEIGPYEGTVLVEAGLFVWEINADGEWTIDC